MTREQTLALLDTAPADGLRATAALVREVARAATGGPWQAAPQTVSDAVIAPDREYETDAQRRCFTNWYGGFPVAESLSTQDREHVLAWQPVVALAVADLLDDEAAAIEELEIAPIGQNPLYITLARAWLTRLLTPAGAP